MLIKPYRLKGKWYKVFVESNGENLHLTSTDIKGAVISGQTLKLPKGFRCLEFLHDINTDGGTATSAMNLDLVVKRYADGTQGINIGSPTGYDYATFYIYGYMEG